MPALVLQQSSGPLRVDLADRPVAFGRSVDCDVQILEERASRRHFVVEPTDRGWVLSDCDSSNGTAVNGYGVSRALLTPGDVIEVGGLEIHFEGDGAVQQHVHRTRRKPPSSTMAWVGALVAFLSIAAATDQIVVSAAVERQATVGRALDELVSAEFAVASSDPDPVRAESALDAFLNAHPDAAEAGAARSRLEGIRAGKSTRDAARADLDELRRLQPTLSAEEYRWRLDAVIRRWADDAGAAAELRRGLGSAEPGDQEDARITFQRHRKAAQAAVSAGEFGRAVSIWMAHAAEIPAGQAQTLSDLRVELSDVEGLAERRAAEVIAQANALRDAGKRDEAEKALRDGVVRLRGTAAARRILARLEGGIGPTLPPSAGRSGAGATGETSRAPRSVDSAALSARRRALWLQANEAEQFVALRDYGEAARRYEAIATSAADVPDVKADLDARATELKSVASALEGLRADPKAFGGKPAPASWDEAAAEDLHGALARKSRTWADHLVAAGFAYDQSLRDEARTSVAKALELAAEDDAARDEAGHLFARREGREYPDGGFVADAGEVITRSEWTRRRNAQEIAKLLKRQDSLMERLRKSKTVRSIEKLAEMRSELDGARRHALELIFDEETYFYPYQGRMGEYTPVQDEVSRRVAEVEKIWDNKAVVHSKPDASTASLLKDLDELAIRLRDLRAEPTLAEVELATLRRYFDRELTIRNYFVDPGEVEAFALNDEVLAWNDKNPGVAASMEAKQVLVTNEYRIMFGRRALRLQDKLVLSARAHGNDMSRGGFFDHFNVRLRDRKPGEEIPEQACGCSSRSIQPGCTHGPDARIRHQGYEFMGCSENIHAGSGDPESAHKRWCHSSGHHRNILQQAWTEMGTGQVGKFWTQNFGLPVTYDAGNDEGAGSSRWDRAGGRGTGGDGNDPEDER